MSETSEILMSIDDIKNQLSSIDNEKDRANTARDLIESMEDLVDYVDMLLPIVLEIDNANNRKVIECLEEYGDKALPYLFEIFKHKKRFPSLKNIGKIIDLPIEKVREIVDPDSKAMWIRVHQSYMNTTESAERIEKKKENLKREIEKIDNELDAITKLIEEDRNDYMSLSKKKDLSSVESRFKRDHENRLSKAVDLTNAKAKITKELAEDNSDKPTPKSLLLNIAEFLSMANIDECIAQEAIVSLPSK